MRRIALLAAASFLATGGAQAQVTQAPGVGVVAFANSGAPHAQRAFQRGVALLHNFEYPRAIAAFQEAHKADPGFAMAYWGEAMAHNHPIWMAQDLEAGRAALAKLGPDRGARLAKAATDRERGFLEAVETLYGDGTKQDRDRAYSARMEALYRAYPRDVDVASFYALSLLGLAHQGRDVPLYMRAAALLEEVYPENRDHPGVLHYLIHSYDDPAHAPLGLRAARRYGAVAPDAGHALHMTSHIFLAMGLWDDSAAANVAAMTTVDRHRAASGQPPFECGHYAEWLVYSEYQRGRADAADAQVELCRRDAIAQLAQGERAGPVEPPRSLIRSYVGMAVRRLIETGQWSGAEGLNLPEGDYLGARFTLAYGDLLAAGGDAARIGAAHARLRETAAALRAARGSDADPALARREEIVLMQAAALERFHVGDAEAGLAALRTATETERTIPAEFGPPLVEKPSHELLGDLLTRLGRRAEATRAYEAALALAPGRRLALRGLSGAESASAQSR